MAAADQAMRLDRPRAIRRRISPGAAHSDREWINSRDPDSELAALAVREQLAQDRKMRDIATRMQRQLEKRKQIPRRMTSTWR